MFGFPKTTREENFQYHKNLLKSVTYQLRYPTTNILVNDEAFLRQRLETKFPNIKELVQGKMILDWKNKTPILHQAGSSMSGYEFRSQDGQTTAHITTDAFTFTILGDAYTNFNEIFTTVQDDFFPVLTEKHVVTYQRVAMRKINVIEFELEKETPLANSFALIFNEPLVNHLFFFPCADSLRYGINRVSFKRGDYQLNIVYGLLEKNPGILHHQMVLDIDLFALGKEITLEDVPLTMKKINAEMFNIFTWAFQDSLLQTLLQQGDRK